jgi:prepilin-type N-terminal cleavage/methylation domain-containing protein
LAVCHHCETVDRKEILNQVQNDRKAVTEFDKQSAETLTRISNFREAQIEILPSHRERGFTRLTSSKKAAFTLAETLIVIAVVGIVAALTIPTLIKNYQKRQTATKLKKIYTILAQATRQSLEDNDGFDYPTVATRAERLKFYNKYYAPYLKMAQICTSQSQCPSVYNAADVTVIFPDEIQVVFQPEVRGYMYVGVDINGKHGPNRDGRDLFSLDVIDGLGLVFLGKHDGNNKFIANSRDELKNGVKINGGSSYACCNDNCSSSGFKYLTCGALIQADGWQIKDDYPW